MSVAGLKKQFHKATQVRGRCVLNISNGSSRRGVTLSERRLDWILFYAYELLVVLVCSSHLLPPNLLLIAVLIPSAGQLMEAVRVKMKERKVLTEELATLATPVSEKA
ncbi:hypothetical protein D9C73_002390 [Collichthys lucidus]|uniref:Uncharacterized protein n=1 Tax=Collichthys lucidus TaxID=240159 RepID=A0A4U5U2Y3_COLLU|nr:hypothetical protein D9C73_002390 [Collichthys lucidus]